MPVLYVAIVFSFVPSRSFSSVNFGIIVISGIVSRLLVSLYERSLQSFCKFRPEEGQAQAGGERRERGVRRD